MFLELIVFLFTCENIPFVGILLLLFTFGAGLSLTWIPSNSLGISALSRDRAGIASGAITTIQETGGALGLALSGSLLRATEKHHFIKLTESKGMPIAESIANKAKTLLSDPEKWYAYLRTKLSYSHEQLLTLFKSSFLFGLRSALFLAIFLIIAVVTALVFLSKKPLKKKN